MSCCDDIFLRRHESERLDRLPELSEDEAGGFVKNKPEPPGISPSLVIEKRRGHIAVEVGIKGEF